MKYLCLISATRLMEDMTPAEATRHFQEYAEFTRELKLNGQFVSANRLRPPSEATTVRVRHGEILTTDGPYAETKEQLGGYFVIDAQDLNAAIRIAARIPAATFGSIELRPIADDAETLALAFDV